MYIELIAKSWANADKIAATLATDNGENCPGNRRAHEGGLLLVPQGQAAQGKENPRMALSSPINRRITREQRSVAVAEKDIKVPFRWRMKAWWEGYDVADMEAKLRARNGKATYEELTREEPER